MGSPGRFYLVSAGAFEAHDHDVLGKLAPTDGSVTLTPDHVPLGVLVLAGRKSRDVFEEYSPATKLSNADFPLAFGQAGKSRWGQPHPRMRCASISWASWAGELAPPDRATET